MALAAPSSGWIKPETTTFGIIFMGVLLMAPMIIRRIWDSPVTLEMMPTFLMGILLILIGAIGLAVHRIQTYTRDCVRYRGYIDNE